VAAAAQAPPGQQQQQKPPPPTQAQLIAAIIPALAAAVTVAGVFALLAALMLAAGIGYAALKATIALVLSMPLPVMEGTGSATRFAVRTNTLRRAQFMLSASRRVQAAVAHANAHGLPVFPAIQTAITAEQRYYGLHVAMGTKRMSASAAVDGMVEMHGNLLMWNAVLDSRTTAGCRAANGCNFYADDPPVVEGAPALPGAVHGLCRCWASSPRKGAPVLPGSLPRKPDNNADGSV
jgi:hypothetical protein